jgi:hypothetical protein
VIDMGHTIGWEGGSSGGGLGKKLRHLFVMVEADGRSIVTAYPIDPTR